MNKMDEGKRLHLEFIQNIITRMNTNSFYIKGLAITIVSALMAIYATTPKIIFIFIGIPPTILFWLLDSYYLQQERKFRGVYNDVTGLKQTIDVKPYEMPIQKYTKHIDKHYFFWNVFFSKRIVWLYLSIVILLCFIMLLIKFENKLLLN